MMRNRSPRHSSASPAVIAATANSSVTIAGARASIGTTFADSHGRDQRHQQDAGKQFLVAGSGARGLASNNLTAVQENHFIAFKFANLRLW